MKWLLNEQEVIEIYDKLRSGKNYKEADLLRQQLHDNDFKIETTKEGSRIIPIFFPDKKILTS